MLKAVLRCPASAAATPSLFFPRARALPLPGGEVLRRVRGHRQRSSRPVRPDSKEHRATRTAWDAVSVGTPDLFFYNANDGSAATVRIIENEA